MSVLTKLEIRTVRNIKGVELSFSPSLNIIFGINGSGKTSILESIHLLGVGRSFRTSKTASIISETGEELTIFAETDSNSRIGLIKAGSARHRLKLDGKLQNNWDSVARALPVQILSSKSFLLLEGGPKSRRMFLDWGVVLVKQPFVQDWRSTKKCVANRNLLLKSSQAERAELEAWEEELSASAFRVDAARREYFEQLEPVFRNIYESMVVDVAAEPISLEYWRGWPEGESLKEILANDREKDRRYGSTQSGPQRADLLVKAGQRPASDVLSRGQQKVLICALKIAQGILHSSLVGDECIYLIDDLPADLDDKNRMNILAVLVDLGCQLIITCVDLESIENCLSADLEKRTFHVERGTITN